MAAQGMSSVRLPTGKNMDATKIFIDYAISPETQARFAEIMFYAPSNMKADVNDEKRRSAFRTWMRLNAKSSFRTTG